MLIVIQSAQFAQNPILCSPFFSVIYNVGLCRTLECCLCVGTRQALLQGRLLCPGFACLAKEPDLVRWLFFLRQRNMIRYFFHSQSPTQVFVTHFVKLNNQFLCLFNFVYDFPRKVVITLRSPLLILRDK